MNIESAVVLKQIQHFSGDYQVLDNVSMEIPMGKNTIIMGPSGCGKSSLLKIAAGLITPSAGKVILYNRNLDTLSHKKNILLRRDVGFVFQDAALWANKSIYENLSLPLRYHFPKMSKNDIRLHIEKHLKDVPFSDDLNLRPNQLSMGERKIISFIRGIITDPNIIFLDEPLASIDYKSGEAILAIIKSLKKREKTIISITHNQKVTSLLAEYLIVMKEGKVLAVGNFRELLKTKDKEVQSILSEVIESIESYDQDILELLDSDFFSSS